MPSTALKKQQLPLICYFRLYGVDKADLKSVSGPRRGAHNAVARAGTLAEIARLKAAASPVSAKEAKAIASYKKVTGRSDIDLILAKEMREHVMRSAAHNRALSTCVLPAILSSTGTSPVVARVRKAS